MGPVWVVWPAVFYVTNSASPAGPEGTGSNPLKSSPGCSEAVYGPKSAGLLQVGAEAASHLATDFGVRTSQGLGFESETSTGHISDSVSTIRTKFAARYSRPVLLLPSEFGGYAGRG